MKSGKRFEQNFKKSIPENTFCLRLKDGTASWGEQSNTRFQHYNPCDFLIHHKGFLFLLELKSHKGKSIPFTCIRQKQLEELVNISRNYSEEISLMAFNFADIEETYLVHIADIEDYIQSSDRKSFPVSWVSEVGYYVPQEKKKVNYKYDIVSALNTIIEEIPQ